MLYPQHRNEKTRLIGYIEFNSESHCIFHSYDPAWAPVRITTGGIVPSIEMRAAYKSKKPHSTSILYEDYVKLLGL